MSSRRSAAAPPAVAAHTASAGVKPMSRTATAMQNAMLVVYELPGLQSVASATVTPASRSRGASGYGDAGGEFGARQQGGHGAARRRAPSTSASVA